jgi:hypothetical protein
LPAIAAGSVERLLRARLLSGFVAVALHAEIVTEVIVKKAVYLGWSLDVAYSK